MIAVNDVAHFLVFSGGILFWFPLLVVRCMLLLSYLDSIRCFMRFGWYMLMAEQFGCKFCFANSSGTTYVSVCLSRKSWWLLSRSNLLNCKCKCMGCLHYSVSNLEIYLAIEIHLIFIYRSNIAGYILSTSRFLMQYICF